MHVQKNLRLKTSPWDVLCALIKKRKNYRKVNVTSIAYHEKHTCSPPNQTKHPTSEFSGYFDLEPEIIGRLFRAR